MVPGSYELQLLFDNILFNLLNEQYAHITILCSLNQNKILYGS